MSDRDSSWFLRWFEEPSDRVKLLLLCQSSLDAGDVRARTGEITECYETLGRLFRENRERLLPFHSRFSSNDLLVLLDIANRSSVYKRPGPLVEGRGTIRAITLMDHFLRLTDTILRDDELPKEDN